MSSAVWLVVQRNGSIMNAEVAHQLYYLDLIAAFVRGQPDLDSVPRKLRVGEISFEKLDASQHFELFKVAT